MKNIQTKVSDSDYEKLKRIAEGMGMSIYELLRYIIAKFLEENGESPENAPEIFYIERKLTKRIEQLERQLQSIKQKIDSVEGKLQGLELQMGGMSKWLKGKR